MQTAMLGQSAAVSFFSLQSETLFCRFYTLFAPQGPFSLASQKRRTLSEGILFSTRRKVCKRRAGENCFEGVFPRPLSRDTKGEAAASPFGNPFWGCAAKRRRFGGDPRRGRARPLLAAQERIHKGNPIGRVSLMRVLFVHFLSRKRKWTLRSYLC